MRFDTPLADRVTAAILFALGAAMSWGGFVMDRLEIRQIHPASIPGLVPMILGAFLMICAVLLALGTRGKSTPRGDVEPHSVGNFTFTAVWSCVFALILVGSLPFWLATAIYILVFSGWFLIPETGGGARLRTGILLLIFAFGMAVGISALFRYGFLVRLP
ncbi:tripartite tricarboxylate transporter TctB family protein [Halovulum sp. GXIMD14794]